MTDPVIDMNAFGELQDTAGVDFVAELVGTFLEEAPGMLAELRTARDAADEDRFKRAAHSLKSNSQTFGAQALGRMARELELAGLASDPTALDALDAAYALVANTLKGVCHG